MFHTGLRISEFCGMTLKDVDLKNKTIMSIAGIVIGVILMIWRGTVVEQMIRVVGYVLLAAAAVYLVMYYQGKKQNTG